MKSLFLKILQFIARLIPLGVYSSRLRREPIDFFYHAVSDEPMEHARWLYSVVPVAQFDAALQYIRTTYTPVDYHQLHAHCTQGQPLPTNAAHISFDDGFRECFSIARPLLLDYEIPCTFFVATDWIDNRAMFYRNKISLCVERLHVTPSDRSNLAALTSDATTPDAVIHWLKQLRLPDEPLIDEICRMLGVDWESFLSNEKPYLTRKQIQQMCAEGFVIGAHTKTHRKLMDLSDAEIETEIVESCQLVQQITGQAIVPFSFPHSAFGVSRALLADIRARHPLVGLLFDTKGVQQDVGFIVNRIWAERSLPSSGGSGVGVERKLSSLPELLHNAYQEAWVDEVMSLGRKLRGK